ncbi:MAG: hypothetical protein JSW12_17255 [Deltaproteobacteria bacterium]|nr:MAG: hypothetical protein JSW12_17255 [Deltaproteobacteria bacterium]
MNTEECRNSKFIGWATMAIMPHEIETHVSALSTSYGVVSSRSLSSRILWRRLSIPAEQQTDTVSI